MSLHIYDRERAKINFIILITFLFCFSWRFINYQLCFHHRILISNINIRMKLMSVHMQNFVTSAINSEIKREVSPLNIDSRQKKWRKINFIQFNMKYNFDWCVSRTSSKYSRIFKVFIWEFWRICESIPEYSTKQCFYTTEF